MWPENSLRSCMSDMLASWSKLMVPGQLMGRQRSLWLPVWEESVKIGLWSLQLPTGALVWAVSVSVKLAFEFYHRNIIKISPSVLLLPVNDSQRFSSNKSYFPKSSHWLANTTSSLSDIHSSVHSHLPSWRQDSFCKPWMLIVYKALSCELWGSLPLSMPSLKFASGSKAKKGDTAVRPKST